MNTFAFKCRSSKTGIRIATLCGAFSLVLAIRILAFGQEKEEATRGAAASPENDEAETTNIDLPGRILLVAALDAERVARKTFPYGLIAIEPNSGQWDKLLDAPTGAGYPTISRDGRYCFFSYLDAAGGGVSMFDIAAGPGIRPRRVSNRTGEITCGPKGDEVIISRRETASRRRNEKNTNGKQLAADNLSTMPSRASHWRVLLGDGAESKLDIPANHQIEDWSPDGKWLITTSHIASGEVRSFGDLFLMRPDGSEQRRLTNHGAGCSWPRFSSDGTQVAYSYSAKSEEDDAHYSSIRIIDVATGQDRELIGHKNTLKDGRFKTPYLWYHFPSWRFNNEWLAVSCERLFGAGEIKDTPLFLISKDGNQKIEMREPAGVDLSYGPHRTYWQPTPRNVR